LVSKCLKTVFGPDAYEFSIVFEKKRGKTEARFVFLRGGEEYDPVSESGMGYIEVSNFVLTLVEIIMTGKRRLVIMDEPFKGLHGDENRERLASLLPVLCDELGFQMVLATGASWLMSAGECVQIKKT
jgi:hypothetical protein